jgi:hypothetical protein
MAAWNCSKLINEKHFGNLKTWLYPKLRYYKDMLNLSDDKLMENTQLVKAVYLQCMKNLGFIIEDNTTDLETLSTTSLLNKIIQ